MKCAIVVKVAAAAVVAGLAGCTDLKPLQAEVADLKSQVSKLQSDLQAARSASDSANSAAQSASQAASGAQSTANQALAAAQASQSCCDSTNEKIDRMFRRSSPKPATLPMTNVRRLTRHYRRIGKHDRAIV